MLIQRLGENAGELNVKFRNDIDEYVERYSRRPQGTQDWEFKTSVSVLVQDSQVITSVMNRCILLKTPYRSALLAALFHTLDEFRRKCPLLIDQVDTVIIETQP